MQFSETLIPDIAQMMTMIMAMMMAMMMTTMMAMMMTVRWMNNHAGHDDDDWGDYGAEADNSQLILIFPYCVSPLG